MRLILYSNQLTTLPPEVEQLAELKELELTDNPVTDAALEHVKLLGKLWLLDIRGTNVTKEGVLALKQALPKCEIKSDFFPCNDDATMHYTIIYQPVICSDQ